MTDLGAPIGMGDEGARVRLLHVFLSLLDLGVDVGEEETGAGRYGKRTAETVQRFQESQRLDPTGTVDDRTAEQVVRVVSGASRRAASGRILQPDGSPRPGTAVRVRDQNLDGAHQLGAATTDELGWFVVRYDVDQLGRSEKPAADLVVSAYESLRAPDALAESAVAYGAGPVELIELTVPGDAAPTSEYEDLVLRIEPALGARVLADLTTEDVEYLAGTTSIDVRSIGWLAECARRAGDDIPAEAYYVWLQSGLVQPGGGLLAAGKDELLAAIAVAVEHAVVPAALGARPERLARSLDEARANELVAAGPDEPVNAVLGLLEGDEAFDQDATRRLAEVMATRDPAAPIRGQARDAGLSDAQVEGLRGIAALHAVVEGDQPLLVAGLATAAAQSVPASLRVAALREADWALRPRAGRAIRRRGRSGRRGAPSHPPPGEPDAQRVPSRPVGARGGRGHVGGPSGCARTAGVAERRGCGAAIVRRPRRRGPRPAGGRRGAWRARRTPAAHELLPRPGARRGRGIGGRPRHEGGGDLASRRARRGRW